MSVRTAKTYPELRSVWKTGAEFLASFDDSNDGPGCFFHPADESMLPPDAKPGALFSVCIFFLDRNAEFRVHVRVLKRYTDSEKHGLTLEFLPEEKGRKEIVLACAEGDSIPYRRRRHPRIACQLLVRVQPETGDPFDATIISISEGGVRVVTNQRLDLESVCRVSISFPRRLWRLCLRGRVTSTVVAGPDQGFGLEFLFDSPRQQRTLARQVLSLRDKT